MLFNFAKNFSFAQDIYISLATSVHPLILHNMAKLELLKSALCYTAMEQVEGAYFEFGVFEGTSLKAAAKIQRVLAKNAKQEFSHMLTGRKFYGFDSFQGFKLHQDEDAHPIFSESNFTSSYAKCKQRMSKFPEVTLISGYFEDTIAGKNPDNVVGSEKCAVAFIDCDLKGPALIALQFIRPLLQEGTVIVLDDAYCYKAHPEKGTFGAWQEFLKLNPGLQAREFSNFGVTGKSFVLWKV